MSLADPQRYKEDFRQHGYFVLPSAFAQECIAELADELDRVQQQLRAQSAQRGKILGGWAISRLQQRSPLFADFIKDPVFAQLCQLLIGPDADLFWSVGAIKAAQTGKAFRWHQDSGYGTTEPLEYITCWTALDRTTRENGCLWVIPGSHRAGLIGHASEKESERAYPGVEADPQDRERAVPLEMAPGQVAVLSSLVLHKSEPNRPAGVRRGLVAAYQRAGFVAHNERGLPQDSCPVLRGGVVSGAGN
ncbi:MAG: hypothetical protein GKR89_03175 [Candidatus Latescibacteria bacterium]|nr:hypothetical protein [Candidatus Latescibacterota bacterium]